MKLTELHSIVAAEAACLILILLIGVAAIKHWKGVMLTSSILATVAIFSAWSNIMALASTLVYGSASTLMWWQTGNRNDQPISRNLKLLQKITWSVLAVGVAIIILNNLHNIILYLG